MTTVAISLGSNVGDRLGNITAAICELAKTVEIAAVSKIYETTPMYVEAQPDFYNAALVARADIGPLALLSLMKAIEQRVGRTPAPRFGPREIDLDLVSYGAAQYTFTKDGEDWLVLPHPRTPERRFVLQPLADIAPALHLPGLGTVEELLKATESHASTVRHVNDALLSVLSH